MTGKLSPIRIQIDYEQAAEDPGLEQLLRRAAEEALKTEGVAVPVSVHLTVTDDDGIARINSAQRGVDASTDVLSFPSCPFSPAFTAGHGRETLLQEFDPEDGRCFLGDIILSLPHARSQALEYGHSLAREGAYLMTHAMFHLMGYDHMNKEDQKIMREQEEKSLRAIHMDRVTDEDLLEMSRNAMRFSYSPYSHYRVGACLRCEDGAVYTGCNIENSSYGATNCAERTAVFKAVSEGHLKFDAIAIAAQSEAPWPCGICRQVLWEFSPDMRVLVTWDGHVEEAPLKELLPHGFGPAGSAADFLGKKEEE